MHELSIAMSIVDSVIEAAEREGAARIESFTLEIGALAGIDLESLEFALGSAVLNTVLEGVRYKIDAIPARGKCPGCQAEFHVVELFDPCPQCGTFHPRILSGTEMKIKSIEIED
ncbi:MAG: hydrogenase maturation nickel metallochaperone HypA [Bacteroidales bacterium]